MAGVRAGYPGRWGGHSFDPRKHVKQEKGGVKQSGNVIEDTPEPNSKRTDRSIHGFQFEEKCSQALATCQHCRECS